MQAKHSLTGWEQFIEVLTKPDNIPIVGMMVLVFYFTYLAFKQARVNDELIAEGKRDEVLKEMQR